MTTKLSISLLDRYVRVGAQLRERIQKLNDDPEAGLEQATWTAIIAVGGAILAIAVLGLITAWVTSYIAKLPG